jgi:hypothetical protein
VGGASPRNDQSDPGLVESPDTSKLFRGDLRDAMERVMETFSGERANDRRFERGLKILLDGFEKKLG